MENLVPQRTLEMKIGKFGWTVSPVIYNWQNLHAICFTKKALQNAHWSSDGIDIMGIIVWLGMFSQGFTKPFFVELKAKIDDKYY